MKGEAELLDLIPMVVSSITSLLRCDGTYIIEMVRWGGVAVLGHLLDSCPSPALSEGLLLSLCHLEVALLDTELSDDLLVHVFLRIDMWSRAPLPVLQLLLQQLRRMAAEQPAQWARTEAVARLVDGMQESLY